MVDRTYLLLGSGEFEPWACEVELEVLGSATGDGSVVILPTASATEGDDVFDRWAAMGLDHYRSMGVHAEVLPVKERAQALDAAIAARAEAASMVFFSGGKPQHLAEVLQDSPLWEAIGRALDRGAVYGGCSAGAMVASQSAVAARGTRQRSAPDGSSGSGSCPNVSFGVHWDRMRWVPGMRSFLMSRLSPGVWFVGIDEQHRDPRGRRHLGGARAWRRDRAPRRAARPRSDPGSGSPRTTLTPLRRPGRFRAHGRRAGGPHPRRRRRLDGRRRAPMGAGGGDTRGPRRGGRHRRRRRDRSRALRRRWSRCPGGWCPRASRTPTSIAAFGARNLLNVNLDDVYTPQEYLARIEAFADAIPDLDWIVGGGWYSPVFDATDGPHRQDLDAVVPGPTGLPPEHRRARRLGELPRARAGRVLRRHARPLGRLLRAGRRRRAHRHPAGGRRLRRAPPGGPAARHRRLDGLPAPRAQPSCTRSASPAGRTPGSSPGCSTPIARSTTRASSPRGW